MKITNPIFIVTFTLLFLLWGVTYSDALLSMEGIWRRSDTFAHGYFILPISAWLVWRDKANLLEQRTQPSWLPIPFLLGSLFVGLFAYSVDINVLGQLSAVVSLIALIWLVVGNKIAWQYKFPLAFLLFSVPMGENLIPWLQDVTAWFTVNLLNLNGIPVFRDGLYLQTPTGLFEVAVACSGIRYLIASIAVGTLFAYLTYTNTKKQIIFVLFSIVMPIVANGIRAYGIVAIAHYSDMKYATGFDHLIYGWLFFGFVIMLMFWIGGKFADPMDEDKPVKADSAGNAIEINNGSIIFITVALILSGTSLLKQSIPTIEQPLTVESGLELTKYNGSKLVEKSTWGITFKDGIERSHLIDANDVEYFTAKYANKQSKGELISWGNVTHNSDRWTIVGSQLIEKNGLQAEVVHLRNITGLARSYIFYYRVGQFTSVSKNKTKVLQAWNSLSRQSDYSEIYAVSIEGTADTEQATQQLTRALLTLDSRVK